MRTLQPRLVVVFLLCGAQVACVAPAIHTNVPQFADAVTLATENSKGAFQVVDQKYMEVEADALVVDYERTGLDPRKVKHLLTPDELQVRISLLNALQQYAKTLSQVSSDAKLQEFDDQTKAFGKSLQDLGSTDAFKKLLQTSRTQVDVATTAIDALGRWFIEKKRQKDLPQLIEAMQDPVKRAAELLQADIGDRPDDQGTGGSGLRAQLWNEYMQAMIQQSAFIDHNREKLDPVAKAREIRKLPQLVDDRAKADGALRQTCLLLTICASGSLREDQDPLSRGAAASLPNQMPLRSARALVRDAVINNVWRETKGNKNWADANSISPQLDVTRFVFSTHQSQDFHCGVFHGYNYAESAPAGQTGLAAAQSKLRFRQQVAEL